MDVDELSINTIRMLSLDMVQRANSGHPGMPLGAAPMAYVLWSRFPKINPKNPAWQDRDRFVFSAGHGSALLYSMLHLTGYISLDELRRFRQWGSLTPGHPENNIKYGIEATTGPLGQGFANAVGMAMAERHMAARFNRPGHEIVNHYTYAIVSDGDLMEGISAEAASLAGHLRLGRLICLYDRNGITLSGETGLTFTEDVCKRFDSYGWHVQSVKDGNDIGAIEKAIEFAREETSRPSLIAITTHIGHGSPKHDSFGVHGSPLSPAEVIETKRFFDWPLEQEFYVPEDAFACFRKVSEKGAGLNSEWNDLLASYGDRYPDLLKEWEAAVNQKLPEGWDKDIPVFPSDPKGIATRVAGGKVMNSIARHLTSLFGGSGDLDPSTNTSLAGKGSYQCPEAGSETMQGAVSGPWGYDGSNIAFGVREHAMGGTLNGMALHTGLIPFASTFLVFSDYMRPAIRLAAFSKLHVIYIFTHDSIAIGQDGPTHQPIEHLSSLRSIPGLTVIRPCDANETAEAWKMAVLHNEGPVALILTRQNVPVLDRTRYSSAEGLRRGAYVLEEASTGTPDLIFVATGSEVYLTLKAAEILANEGINIRVVSMPSWELFEKQPLEYRNSVLPPEVKARVSVEAAATFGWHKYVGNLGEIIGIDHFGASAPGDVLLEKFGFKVEGIVNKARGILKGS